MKVNNVYLANCRVPEDFSSHCFEGILIAMPMAGDLVLVDTFWGVGSFGSNRSFSRKEANDKFELTLIGNLDDYEECSRMEAKDYEEKDIMRLISQHGCCNSCVHFYKKIGSKPSDQVKIRNLEDKINESEWEIRYNQDKIKNYKARIDQIKSGS